MKCLFGISTSGHKRDKRSTGPGRISRNLTWGAFGDFATPWNKHLCSAPLCIAPSGPVSRGYAKGFCLFNGLIVCSKCH